MNEVYDIRRYDRKDLIFQALEYFLGSHYEELYQSMAEPDKYQWISLTIDVFNLLSKNQVLGNLLLIQGRETMKIFEEALIATQKDILVRMPEQPISIHERIVLRWAHVPPFNDVYRTAIPKSNDANKLLMTRGTVVKANQPRLLEWEVTYQCPQCYGSFSQVADLESYTNQPYPTSCGAPRAPGAKKCTAKRFNKISKMEAQSSRDYQEIKLQEQVQHLNMGAMPRSIAVILLDNAVGLVNAGDDVTITGLVTHRWGMLQVGEKPELELVILGSNISINNERKAGIGVTDEVAREFQTFWQENSDTPLLARNALLRSICPEVYGLYHVKLAIATVLAGGVRLQTATNATRGDSHLLMIGDPGTGKSQLLRFAAKMANRSVLTTGVGTTGAGLTATAVQEQGTNEWALEAGALVLADGGACCIDEFSSIRKQDQTTVHEAMEQQTIHMAKATLVCELHTRCAVLAATNPKGKYNVDESISMNVALGGPLLSRFDLVLVLLDEPDEQWDMSISNFILQDRTRTGQPALPAEEENLDDDDLEAYQRVQRAESDFGISHSSSSRSKNSFDLDGDDSQRMMDNQSTSSQSLPLAVSQSTEKSVYGTKSLNLMRDTWPVEKLQAYLSWVKSNFYPVLSEEARKIGMAYYDRQRQADNPEMARTTARLAQSFVRICQGHAKLMARHVATVQDALFAILLMESSTFTSAIGGKRIPTVRSFFPSDPDSEYADMEKTFLQDLGLTSLSRFGPAAPEGHDQLLRHSPVGLEPRPAPATTPFPPSKDAFSLITAPRPRIDPNQSVLPGNETGKTPNTRGPAGEAKNASATILASRPPPPSANPLSVPPNGGYALQSTANAIPTIAMEFAEPSQSSQWQTRAPPHLSSPPQTHQPRPTLVIPTSSPIVAPPVENHALTASNHMMEAPTGRNSQGALVSSPHLPTPLSALPDLIPLPPDTGYDFGIWEEQQPVPLRLKPAVTSSQMDLDDEDFLM